MLARISVVLAAAVLEACAAQPAVPDPLQPPAGQALVAKYFANGVQIYECTNAQNGGYAWTFRRPEAALSDAAGKPMGTHYAGPTWRALDGSTVAGEAVARAPSKDPASIPQLLLTAKKGDGDGLFSKVASIQRLDTVGGPAPATGCASADDLNHVARIRYTATYPFYR